MAETLTEKYLCNRADRCPDMREYNNSRPGDRNFEDLADQNEHLCTQPEMPETSCGLFKKLNLRKIKI